MRCLDISLSGRRCLAGSRGCGAGGGAQVAHCFCKERCRVKAKEVLLVSHHGWTNEAMHIRE